MNLERNFKIDTDFLYYFMLSDYFAKENFISISFLCRSHFIGILLHTTFFCLFLNKLYKNHNFTSVCRIYLNGILNIIFIELKTSLEKLHFELAHYTCEAQQ